MDPKQNKPVKLREKKVADLETGVVALRKELSQLRVSKVASGVASKLAKIKVRILLFSLVATGLQDLKSKPQPVESERTLLSSTINEIDGLSLLWIFYGI